MTPGTVYVIGAGLAGLAAAVHLAERGVQVALVEAAPQAGGRCRSWFDSQLGEIIDNGNHLILSGNRATFSYLETIGAAKSVVGPQDALFTFCDVRTGSRWTIAPNAGVIPSWMASPTRRVPDTRLMDYAEFVPLLRRYPGKRVNEVVPCRGILWERLMRPLLLAALNTAPEEASAELAGAVIRETLARGGRHCLPRIASPNLAAAFIEPAITFLAGRNTKTQFGQRLRDITLDGARATAIDFGDSRIPLAPEDRVILAVPMWIAAALVPGVATPDQSSAIVNAHYRASPPDGAPAMMGIVGGTAEWIFVFTNRISVTVSGADAIVDRDRAELAQLLWRDVSAALRLSDTLPPWQIVKEKRATFRATPEQAARRAPSRTRWRNLFLAGDWTATGLPGTIEGAVRSGHNAARLAIG